MALDPYGFRAENVEAAPPGDTGAPALVVTTLAGLAALVTCASCSGVMTQYEAEPGDDWQHFVGVWIVLIGPAWPFAGVAIVTPLLHLLGRRWWTSLGPNLLIGGCGGAFAWLFCFIGWVFLMVLSTR